MAVLPPPYQLDTMDEIEDNIGIEIEAPTTFSGAALADEDTVQGYDYDENEEDNNEQLDGESMNDESVNDATSYATAGYSYITSNIKWFVIAMASFAVFFGIGIGLGYGPIGNSIYGNDNDASVSAATVDFTTSDNGAKSGKGEGGGGTKSGKSSGVSYTFHIVHMILNVHFVHMMCTIFCTCTEDMLYEPTVIYLPHIIS